MAIVRAIRTEEPPAALDSLQLPAPVSIILARCWEQNPGARPTMAEIEEMIRLQTQNQMMSPMPTYTTRRRREVTMAPKIDFGALERTLVSSPPFLSLLDYL